MKQNYLSLCAIVRDQEHYIKEWLAFHRIVGVEKFYLRLNDCEDKTYEKIRELSFSNDIAVYHDHPKGDDEGGQPSWYRFVLREYGHLSRWMLLIDSDEFFFGTNEDHLPNILQHYEEHGGLAANWVMFGHNKRLDPPQSPKELSIEAFSKRLYVSNVVKSCIQPGMIDFDRLGWNVIHTMPVKKPVVLGDYTAIDDPVKSEKALTEPVRINHYHYRSLKDYMKRLYYVYENAMYPERGLGKRWANVYEKWSCKAKEEWLTSEGRFDDPTILRFASRIREAIQ